MKPKPVQEAYAAWSATYDTIRNLTRNLDAQVTRQQLSGLQVDAALEMGCGTGKNSAFLSSLAGRLTALDFSPAMLAQARDKIGDGRVDFIVADITTPWPFYGAIFDLITCNLILEHVIDLPFVFGQARRALRKGGQFFVSELHPFRQYQGTQANFQHGGKTVTIPAYTHHISDYWRAAEGHGFNCLGLGEWWHDQDDPVQPPRLISLLFGIDRHV